MDTVLHDSKGRQLLVINDDGKFAFSRFADFEDQEKADLIKIYEDLTGKTSEEFVKFINFKDDKTKFCS